MPVEFEKMKAQRHSAPMKKASEEALVGSIWESPYPLHSRLCGLFSLFAQPRQIGTHQRVSDRRQHSIAAAGNQLVLPELYPVKLFTNDASAIELKGINEAKFSQYRL